MSQVQTGDWLAALPSGTVPVGISRGIPRRAIAIKYRRLRALEPGPWFRSVVPTCFLELYGEILDRLDPTEIYDRLIAFGDNPVMVCWETASDCHSGKAFCHRHLVAQWLEDRPGIEVTEVGHPKLRVVAVKSARAIAERRLAVFVPCG